MPGKVYFDIKMISTLGRLTYKNIEKWQMRFSMFRTTLSLLFCDQDYEASEL